MEDFLMNRLANARNSYQGKTKRVLCVCSAGLLRSPTAAVVLSQEPFNYNTRAAGLTPEFALIPVDRVLLEWADEIVCMSNSQAIALSRMIEDYKPVISLDIPDNYGYRDPELMRLIYDRYQEKSFALASEKEKED